MLSARVGALRDRGPLIAGFPDRPLVALGLLVRRAVRDPAAAAPPRPAHRARSAARSRRARYAARVRLAVVAAVGLAIVQEAGTRLGWVGAVLLVVGLALLGSTLGCCCRPVRSASRRGLPTVVVMRGLLAGAFFAGEAFVPLALQTERGATTAQAGIRAHGRGDRLGARLRVQGPYARLPKGRLVEIGAVFVAGCLSWACLSLVPSRRSGVIIPGWMIGAMGMGMSFGLDPARSSSSLAARGPGRQRRVAPGLRLGRAGAARGSAGTIYGAALAAGAVCRGRSSRSAGGWRDRADRRGPRPPHPRPHCLRAGYQVRISGRLSRTGLVVSYTG